MPKRLPVHQPARPRGQAPAADLTRPSAARRGYGRDWRRRREQHIAAHPFCEDCKDAGRTVEAEHVDHVKALTAGGDHTDTNLRSLCAPCHSRKTVRVDGGLGRPRQEQRQ